MTWSEQSGSSNKKSTDLGLEADSFNITGLKTYRLYLVQVAGRTNGGAGITNDRQVMTDEDGKQILPHYMFQLRFSWQHLVLFV